MINWYIKKKIREIAIKKGAIIITNTAENYLDENTAEKVNDTINFATKILVESEELVIDAGAEMISKTAKKMLDEETANKVNQTTHITANLLKQL
jgi:alpha-glucosidase (family GH31 glycosyl hydrolase)